MRLRERLVNGLVTVVEYMLWLHYPWDLFWWALGKYKPAMRYVRFIIWLEGKRPVEDQPDVKRETTL